MSVEQIRSAVGEDGIDIAVKTLKDVASADHTSTHTYVSAQERITAATTLLRYGLASYDTFGNAQVA